MKFINGMANISIKSAKLTPFGGIFSIMEQFDSKLSSVIDSTLGIRSSTFGYQYSEIIRSLMSVFFISSYPTFWKWNTFSRFNLCQTKKFMRPRKLATRIVAQRQEVTHRNGTCSLRILSAVEILVFLRLRITFF